MWKTSQVEGSPDANLHCFKLSLEQLLFERQALARVPSHNIFLVGWRDSTVVKSMFTLSES